MITRIRQTYVLGLAVIAVAGCAGGGQGSLAPSPIAASAKFHPRSTPADATLQFVITVNPTGPTTGTVVMTASGNTIFSGTCIEGSRLSALGGKASVLGLHTYRQCTVSSPSGQSGTLNFDWRGTAGPPDFSQFTGNGVMNHGTADFSGFQGTFTVQAVVNFGVGANETWTGQFQS